MRLPSADLLTDVFNFLCFLHADDVHPSHSRFLTLAALEKINASFLLPDDLRIPSPRRVRGKRGLTERQTERIRFVHFLCEIAHLVALTGRFLKPTPRAAHWLTGSDFERTQILFAVFLTDNRRLDDLWRAYRLPGFRLDPYPHILAPFLDLLRTLPQHQTVKLATLLRMIPLDVFDDTPENQPAMIWCDVLRYLSWFGVIAWREHSSFRLTDLGMALLGRRAAPRPASSSPAPPLQLAPPLNIVASSASNLTILYQLAEYAELISMRPYRVYRLDRARVHRQLQRGDTFAHLVRFLENATHDALPHTLTETLLGWAQELDAVTIRRATLLQTRDRATMEQLMRVRGIRACIRRTLSPRAVTLRVDRLPALIRQLKHHGYSPRVELPPPESHATRRQFDDPMIAHLYLAARIGHVLPELIPALYRVPYSIVLELEKQLSERDHTLTTELVEELTNGRQRPTVDRGRTMPTRSVLHPSSSVLQTIARALDADAPLEITYYTASRDETTTRVVEPLRIEWRGRVPYLIAFCRLRGDERVFRVERILEMNASH